MSRRPLVPEAKGGLERMKTEFSNEVGMKLNDSYNGDNSSRLNGFTGGPTGGLMTKKMVEDFEKKLAEKYRND